MERGLPIVYLKVILVVDGGKIKRKEGGCLKFGGLFSLLQYPSYFQEIKVALSSTIST